ncbi:MAG: hypothetical protein ACTH45_06365 [Lactobacillus helveticus]
MMKKILNITLLIAGIICSCFLLLQALPSFLNLVTKADVILKILVVLEAILLIVLPILSWFPQLRMTTIVLAVVLIIMLIFKWFPVLSIIYIIDSLLVIGFNVYFK